MYTCSFMRSIVYDYICSLMLTPDASAPTQISQLSTLLALWFLLIFARQKILFLPSEKHRQKGERLLPPMGCINLRSRPCSTAMDDAHHYDQGQLRWDPCGTPQPGFLMSSEVMLPIFPQWKCLFVSLFSTTSAEMNLSMKQPLCKVRGKYVINTICQGVTDRHRARLPSPPCQRKLG